MLTDDILTDVKPQPGPFTLRFRGKERSKDLLLKFRCDTGASVPNLQLKHSCRINAGSHSNFTLALHCMSGIHHQVDHHLFDFIRVNCQHGDFSELRDKVNRLTLQLKTKQLQDFDDQVVQINDTILRIAATGERKQPSGQILQPFNFQLYLFKHFFLKTREWFFALQKFGGISHHGERIIDLVGDPGRKTAHLGKLLTLNRLVQQSLKLCDIFDNDDNTSNLFLIEERSQASLLETVGTIQLTMKKTQLCLGSALQNLVKPVNNTFFNQIGEKFHEL